MKQEARAEGWGHLFLLADHKCRVTKMYSLTVLTYNSITTELFCRRISSILTYLGRGGILIMRILPLPFTAYSISTSSYMCAVVLYAYYCAICIGTNLHCIGHLLHVYAVSQSIQRTPNSNVNKMVFQ